MRTQHRTHFENPSVDCLHKLNAGSSQRNSKFSRSWGGESLECTNFGKGEMEFWECFTSLKTCYSPKSWWNHQWHLKNIFNFQTIFFFVIFCNLRHWMQYEIWQVISSEDTENSSNFSLWKFSTWMKFWENLLVSRLTWDIRSSWEIFEIFR